MHVYVISRASDGLVKIGRSNNPEQRIRNLSMQGGFEVFQMWISRPLKSAKDTELAAHDALADRRRIGEWFDVPFEKAVNVVLARQDALKPSDGLADFSLRLKATIDQSGIKQVEIAQRLEITVQAVSQWTTGSSKNVNIKHLFTLADMLGVSARWLVTGEKDAADILAPLTPAQRAQALRMLEAFAASCASEGDE